MTSFRLVWLALTAVLFSGIACGETQPAFTEQAGPTSKSSEKSPAAPPTSPPASTPEPPSTTTPVDLDSTLTATVVQIIDGDTIEVIIDSNWREIVRLAGVDTPEIFSPNRMGEYGDITDTDCLDLWATKAAQFSTQTLKGKSIILEINQPDQRDTHDRLLGYLTMDGEDFNSKLIEEGYARVYEEHESSNKDQYLSLQSKAMSEARGLWECSYYQVADTTPSPEPTIPFTDTASPAATPEPTSLPTATPPVTPSLEPSPTPTEIPTATPRPTPQPTATPTPEPSPTPTEVPTATPRPTPQPTAIPTPTPTVESQVVISCIFYDGSVLRSETDEYVAIVNVGNAPQNLENWVLKDVSTGSPSFEFPNFSLVPGREIRVYTNEIHSRWGGFSFGSGKAIWNNSKPDTAALFDASGEEVSQKSYPPGC